MNLLKSIAVGLTAAAAMTGMASAVTSSSPTIIYICGSTAFRAPVTCALIHALGANCRAAGNGTPITKAQTGIFADGTVHFTSGVFDGTATTIVETNWTGSLAGCLDLATQNSALQYVDSTNSGVDSSMTTIGSVPFGSNSAGVLPAFVTSGAGQNVITHAPQVAMTDAFATSAASALSGCSIKAGQNIDGATTGSALATLVKNAPLVEAGSTATDSSNVFDAGNSAGYLGIVPFEWVLGDTGLASVPFSNITQQTANYLIKNGGAPFTMFSTNNAAAAANSAGDFAYLIGRNEDSGTRIDSLAEPQLGFVANPKQFLLTFSNTSVVTSDLPKPTDFTQIGGAGNQVETFAFWPAGAALNTEVNISWPLSGHGGYAGGGDVASVLKSTPDENNIDGPFIAENTLQSNSTGGNVYFIGYLGTADAGGIGTTTISGGTALQYDGVTCSSAAIQNGSYSFWSYEHMYYLGSGTGSIVGTATQTFIDNLAADVSTTYAVYDNNGAAAPTTDGAGVFILANAGTAATTQGSVSRTVEGGGYTLNY